MINAYQEFISQRCNEIITENEEIKKLHNDLAELIQKIKDTFSPQDFALFCEYESQINNIRVKENRYIYAQARRDNL